MAVFRFAQRLSQILQGRNLTAEEVAGLDRYDLEIEDRVDSGGDTVWTVGDADVSGDTVQLAGTHQAMIVGLPIGTAGFAELYLSPGAPTADFTSTDTFLQLFTQGNNTTGYADLEASNIDITATDTVTITGATIGLVGGASGIGIQSVSVTNVYGAVSASLTAAGSVGVTVTPTSVTIATGTSSTLTFVGLPTSNPGGSNRVWNSAGTLKIT